MANVTAQIVDANGQDSLPAPARSFDARAVILSFLDQGLYSLSSLILSAALIATSDPATFGRFIFIVGCTLVAASLHYGAIGVPMLVHVRQSSGSAREHKLAVLRNADFLIRTSASALVGAGAYLATGTITTAIAGAAFAAAWLARETRRNLFYLDGDSAGASRFSATSFAALLPVYATLLYLDRSETMALLSATLATSLALVLFPAPKHARASMSDLLQNYRVAFPGAGWTIVNSATNEAQTRIHVFVIQFFRGADQLGLIEAGRIVWAPLQLLGSAWQRIAQPRIASLVEAGDVASAQRLTLVGIALMAAATAVTALVLYAFWGLVAQLLFASFAGIETIVAGWAIFSLLMLSNWALIVFLNAAHRFRAIALVGLTGSAATAALLTVMMLEIDLIAALVVMAFVQAGVLCAFLVLCVQTGHALKMEREP